MLPAIRSRIASTRTRFRGRRRLGQDSRAITRLRVGARGRGPGGIVGLAPAMAAAPAAFGAAEGVPLAVNMLTGASFQAQALAWPRRDRSPKGLSLAKP